ncbi:MAG: histone-like protein [Candidatus Helarchaeota archaeon]
MAPKANTETKEASLIVKSAVRKYLNSKNCNVSAEVLQKTLNNAIKKILNQAIENAKNAKRKTIKPSDIPKL